LVVGAVEPAGGLETRDDSRRHFAKCAEVRAEFRKDFGLPAISEPWVDFDLDPETINKLIEWIKPREQNKTACFERAHLTEHPTVSSPEWFLFRPHRRDLRIERDTEGVECLTGFGVKVSDQFVKCVQQHGMTGIRFVPERESHRFRQRREWFDVLPAMALGRGLDHPWVDRRRHEQKREILRRNVGLRRRGYFKNGIRYFDNDHLRKNPRGMSPAWRALLTHFPGGEVHLEGAPRLARRHLRRTDFALLLRFDNQFDLCVKAEAAKLLIAQGILSPKDCRPIVVLESEPATVRELDLPVRIQSLPAVARIAENLNISQPSVPESPRWSYEWSPEVALEAARRELGKSSDYPRIRAEDLNSAIREIGLPVPEMWRQIMLSASEWDSFCEFIIPSVAKWVRRNNEYRDYLAEAAREPGHHYLYLGDTMSGDTFALELPNGPTKTFDAPLLMLDHEIGRFSARWPSIAHYVEEWLRR